LIYAKVSCSINNIDWVKSPINLWCLMVV